MMHRFGGKKSRRFLVCLLGITGGLIALALFGGLRTAVGPFDTTLSFVPSATGRTQVELAPLGALSMPTHNGPLGLRVTVDRVRLADAEELLKNPGAVSRLQTDVGQDVERGVQSLLWRSALVVTAGGALLAWLAGRRRADALLGGLSALAVLSVSVGIAASTFRASALSEPRFTGLLTLAPQAIGNVRTVSSKLAEYRESANELAANVSRLYQAASLSGTATIDDSSIRILHVSDLHLNPAGFDLVQLLITQFRPDVIVDSGDINDWGTTFESAFADRIGKLGVPYVYVRGNHDSEATAASVAAQPNAVVLDGTPVKVGELRFWGIGDPRFTADKTLYETTEQEKVVARQARLGVLNGLLRSEPPEVDVAVVHDPAIGASLQDAVPLVLSGHLHRAELRDLGGTHLLVSGSTGGAGLRGAVQGGESVPLSAAVLYLDRSTRQLVAYDSVRVAGLGQAGAEIERKFLHNP